MAIETGWHKRRPMSREAYEKVDNFADTFKVAFVEGLLRKSGTPLQVVPAEFIVLVENGLDNGKASLSGVLVVEKGWRET